MACHGPECAMQCAFPVNPGYSCRCFAHADAAVPAWLPALLPVMGAPLILSVHTPDVSLIEAPSRTTPNSQAAPCTPSTRRA